MAQNPRVAPRTGMNDLVRKTLITAATGGAAFILSNVAKQPQSSSLLLSILIGGVTLLVQFLSDLEDRQRSVEDRLDRVEGAQSEAAGQIRHVVRAEIAKINDATALYERLGRSPLDAGAIGKLVMLSSGLAGSRRDLAHKVAQAEIDSAVAFLEQLVHGAEISYEGEDRDWLLALTQATERSIDATSRGSWTPDGNGYSDEGFWDSELSHRYLEWQRDAIRRGVTVRRLFLLENADLMRNPEFRRICDQQRGMGIVIRVLDASALSPSRRLLLPDLVLFDEEVSYELTAGPRVGTMAPYFVRTRLVVQPQTVRDRIRLFTDFWELSVDYT